MSSKRTLIYYKIKKLKKNLLNIHYFTIRSHVVLFKSLTKNKRFKQKNLLFFFLHLIKQIIYYQQHVNATFIAQ